MKLGGKIRSIRKERQWSTDYLAEKANVSKTTINEIENDKRSPTYETIEKICLALNVSFIDVLPIEYRISAYTSTTTKEEMEFSKLIQLLTDNERKHLFGFLQAIVTNR